MKIIWLILFALSISASITAQSKRSMVILKNGTVLNGVIKSIDPTDALTMVIGGVETTVKMDNVLSIDDVKESPGLSYQTQQITNDTYRSTDNTTTKKDVYVKDTLVNFKGFLLAKGNNVYVRHGNSENNENADYDKQGAKAIKNYCCPIKIGID